ncbi:CASP-like protein 4A3 [Rhododendron vialii]|uniref:CASP-like protein 4A3 n=1 Tax=Rhododendron vialii TaxID=182163 RepID=UPI00265FB3E8|nr:CASP-like protein 4A3 [Rhododendron vialii]
MEKIQGTSHDHDSTNSTPTRSFPPSPDPSFPAPHSPAAESSLSSDLSHHSSLSHASSPEQEKSRKPVSPPARSSPEQEKTRRPDSPPGDSPAYSPARSPSPEPMVFRFARGETEAVRKVDPGSADGGGRRVYGGAAVEVGGGGGRRPRAGTSGLRRGMREETVRKVGLGLRVCGLFFCLVSLAVMASDKNKGWAVDSFFRYKEFRYVLSVNAIGFVYSFAQASYLAYHLATREYIFRHPLRYYFDFGMDQILTYFLMSASSSAATRVEDWLSNWGQDKFPKMATASVVLSYLAFLAFASNSLISGYALCAFRST